MKLIGMYGSPYVRRVAICLHQYKLPFDHHAVSVFAGFQAFRDFNPVAKAPTLICDDGTILMDSTVIIDYLQSLRAPRAGGPNPVGNAQSCRILGLALAACEKTGQLVFERSQRPADKQHETWLVRIRSQLKAAYEGLEWELGRSTLAADIALDSLPHITTAIAWKFTQLQTPDLIQVELCPRLDALSYEMERTPAFLAVPPG